MRIVDLAKFLAANAKNDKPDYPKQPCHTAKYSLLHCRNDKAIDFLKQAGIHALIKTFSFPKD